jgi:hypothetical protein
MNESLKRIARKSINQITGLIGFQLVRKHSWDDAQTFIPFKETIIGAKKAGMSLGDFIDITYNVPGSTRKTIEQMASLGVFQNEIQSVCEIGPGSGRYLEKILQISHPIHYEIYETAVDWANYLVENYHVIYQQTDGVSLASTPSDSIDLVHAHKVFSSTNFLTTVSYLLEMMRVVCIGGKVVFDVVTEDCMDANTLDKWLSAGAAKWPFPSFMPKQYTVELFAHHGLKCVGDFLIPMAPGITQYFVFSK